LKELWYFSLGGPLLVRGGPRIDKYLSTLCRPKILFFFVFKNLDLEPDSANSQDPENPVPHRICWNILTDTLRGS
jgi:hypothetical protein